jgi:hypothetical protein
MASQKDKRSAWAGFISNGQCFALTSRGEQYWPVESKEAALSRLLMVMVGKESLALYWIRPRLYQKKLELAKVVSDPARVLSGLFYIISSHHLIITLPLYAHTDINSTDVL